MPRTHRHRRSQPTGKPRRAADRHRYPVCPTTGKRRLGERKDVVLALAAAERARTRADLHGVPTNRQEVRGYRCASCRGWHLTSRAGREHVALRVNGPHGNRSIRNDGHVDTPRRVPAPRSPRSSFAPCW